MKKIKSSKVTKDIKRKIRAMDALGFLHYHQIATVLNINPGRVSEVLGKKHS